MNIKHYINDMIDSNSSFSVLALREEKHYNKDGSISVNDVLLLKKDKQKFEFSLSNCTFNQVNHYLGITHLLRKPYSFDATLLKEDEFTHDLLSYKNCVYTLHKELFKETARGYDSPPTMLFYGDSNCLKSYFGGLYGNQGDTYTVIETDSYKSVEEVYQSEIYADVVVVGNRFKDIDIDKVKSMIVSDNIIMVNFKR